MRQITTVGTTGDASSATWNAEIPRAGEYTVYISYASLPNSSDAVRYTVHSLRGDETFTVNQTMGGGTWISLGSFPFEAGLQDFPIVTVSNAATGANIGRIVTADAVRIGGGMGNVARGNDSITSGLPRWMEGARYWLQWAGAPVEVYSKSDYDNDYTDDFHSRPLWVNYIAGGSSKMPSAKGLGIPVDISFALHTDAGTTPDSTTSAHSAYIRPTEAPGWATDADAPPTATSPKASSTLWSTTSVRFTSPCGANAKHATANMPKPVFPKCRQHSSNFCHIRISPICATDRTHSFVLTRQEPSTKAC